MKKKLFSRVSAVAVGLMLAACGTTTIDPDTPYIIEGELTSLPDSLVICLSVKDGQTLHSIAFDTLNGGRFRFEQKINDFLNEVHLLVYDKGTRRIAEGFPSMSRTLYVAPGANIKVKGNNAHIYTWKVESDVYEQREYDKLLLAGGDAYEERQDLAIEYSRLNNMIGSMKTDEVDTERSEALLKEVRRQRAEVMAKEDSVGKIIAQRQIAAMKKMEPSQPWLEQLYTFSWMNAFKPFRKDVVEMFNSLPNDVKQSVQGQEIYAQLNPPAEAELGDAYPDATFFDLEGRTHRIADRQGKLIVLDFWSIGCGPCVRAFPEIKELQEKYQDKVAFISISVDSDRRWRVASERYDLTWDNWNEGKGTGGLYINYRINALPCYIVIGTDGKIVQKILGFNKTYFEELFDELLEQ